MSEDIFALFVNYKHLMSEMHDRLDRNDLTMESLSDALVDVQQKSHILLTTIKRQKENK